MSKEHKILRALPLWLGFLMLLAMSLVGYDGYKRTHAKPSEPVVTPCTPENKHPNVSYVPDSGPLVVGGYGDDGYGGGDMYTVTFTVAPHKHKHK